MQEHKENKGAVAYIRVNAIDEDQLHIEEQMKEIRAHCFAKNVELIVVFIDEGQHSKNFQGPGWALLESYLKLHKGEVGSLVVSDPDRLSRDLGLLLLKQHDLRVNFGVTIEVAGGKQLEQQKGFSLN